ncbi:MAG: dihydrolipoamide acetyltransferase family protein [Pirellulales bacterium]
MPHEIRIPRLGWSMEEGVFVGWLKRPGDDVAVGEALFELESDKALQQIESLDAGTLFVPADAPAPGATVPVGALLGFLLSAGEAIPTGRSPPPSGDATAATADDAEPIAAANPIAGPSVRRLARGLDVNLRNVVGTGKHGRITCEDVEAHARSRSPHADRPNAGIAARTDPIASPRARRVAAELGVDWKSLRGTGRGGRIREADVRCAVTSATVVAMPTSTTSRGVPISPRRKAIADRLRKSWQQTIPVTLTTTADATNLVACREQFRSAGGPVVPSYSDIVVWLAADTLTRHPRMAVRWEEGRDALISLAADELHVAIAVDTSDGLLAPVVRGVVGKSILEIAQESRTLIDRARSGRLAAADMQDGAITITNLGRYGIDAFTPVINYPQISILGLGAIRLEPAVTSEGRIAPRHRITLSLTFDHAAIDGKPAASFLRDVVATLESSKYIIS